MSFFFLQIFHDKPNAVKLIFKQKTINSVKTTRYFGFAKSIEYHSFQNFYEKNPMSHDHIVLKNHPLSKKTQCFFMPIFCEKNVHSQKNILLSYRLC